MQTEIPRVLDSYNVRTSRDGTRISLPRLLTVAEAAAYLRVDHSSVRRWINAGEIKAMKIGGRVRIPASEILR